MTGPTERDRHPPELHIDLGSKCLRFRGANGDPKLTNNAEVIGRMTTEAIWAYYNHPSIFWWSMHDEPNDLGLNGHGRGAWQFLPEKTL